jgi:hypothetical protein
MEAFTDGAWSRRRFLKAAGAAGGLGLLGNSVVASSARAGPRVRASSSAGLSRTTTTVNTARLGVFAEPEGSESGYFGAFKGFQKEIGRGVDIYRTYRSWRDPIFNDTINAIYSSANNYPYPELYITFHAFLDSKGNNCLAWSDIAAGRYDAQIDSWSAELKTLQQVGPHHTYLVFHHEMENEEGTPPTGCGTPLDFQAAYWYFRRRVEVHNNVPNLTWVITFMHNTFAPPLKHGGPDRWWPALSPYSDVPNDHLVGVDIYNRNLCHAKEWRTFTDLMNPTLRSQRKQALTALDFSLGKARNLFIGECGTVEGDACGGTLPHGTAKAGWFNDALAEMQAWSNLEAFCYSHVVGFNGGGYRIDTSYKSERAFRGLANDSLFGGL